MTEGAGSTSPVHGCSPVLHHRVPCKLRTMSAAVLLQISPWPALSWADWAYGDAVLRTCRVGGPFSHRFSI